jgi:hypothetical protein
MTQCVTMMQVHAWPHFPGARRSSAMVKGQKDRGVSPSSRRNPSRPSASARAPPRTTDDAPFRIHQRRPSRRRTQIRGDGKHAFVQGLQATSDCMRIGVASGLESVGGCLMLGPTRYVAELYGYPVFFARTKRRSCPTSSGSADSCTANCSTFIVVTRQQPPARQLWQALVPRSKRPR